MSAGTLAHVRIRCRVRPRISLLCSGRSPGRRAIRAQSIYLGTWSLRAIIYPTEEKVNPKPEPFEKQAIHVPTQYILGPYRGSYILRHFKA